MIKALTLQLKVCRFVTQPRLLQLKGRVVSITSSDTNNVSEIQINKLIFGGQVTLLLLFIHS